MSAFLDQLIFFGFFQCILLLLIYAFSPQRRVNVNTYLLILVVLLLMGLTGRIFYILDVLGGSRKWVGLSEFSILFFGPTVYLFTQSTIHKTKFKLSDLVHYIPGVLYSLVITFYYLLAPNEVIIERINTGEFYRVVKILVGIGLTVNLTYWSISIYNFLTFRSNLQQEVSYNITLQFLRNFLVAIGICLMVWLTLYLFSLNATENIEIKLRAFVWTAIALIILFITYYHMITPKVLAYDSLLPKGAKYQQSKFSTKDLDKLKLELEEIMRNKKPYLNQKLLKAELADLMGISNPELARLLNERIGMNFFEFVNYYRIQEFIKLSQSEKGKALTFFAIAQESGFNSKATFNKSFKKIMGCSPSAYLNNHN